MKYLLSVIAIAFAFSLKAQFIVNNGIDIHNSAFVITDGDWINDSPAHIINNGFIFTYADFINNGTLDAGSQGGFTLRSNTAQTFKPGGHRFAHFAKEQDGILTVIGSFSTTDSLIVKSGFVQLQEPTDTIGTIGDAALFYVEEGSWIEGGFLSRSGNGDLVFPLAKDGHYLPLTLHKVEASKVTASVADAPADRTAGPGVEALINFPYVWSVTAASPSDTAAYVEVSYPSTLPVGGENLIVARDVDGQQYRGMGARLIADDGSRIFVRSYSRRLNGLFTVARGFPTDPETDSLALVALYTSTNNGEGWTSSDNWLRGEINTWYGVDVAGQSITRIELPNNELTGPVPDQLVDILSLEVINLSNNSITAIPDFTENPSISSLNVSNNALDFASLEPNASVAGINYLVQSDFGTALYDSVEVGTEYLIHLSAGGTQSEYTWTHNGADIPGASTTDYTLAAVNRETMGEYRAVATNPLLPGLTLRSHPHTVLAHATVGGRFVVDAETPVTDGEITLYRVQPGAFLPVATTTPDSDGLWSFPKVVLDDYQIRGFADTTVYEDALPTYYINTILWEEADTLYLTDHADSLHIISNFKPAPPSGRGEIRGVFMEEVDETGRVKTDKTLRPIARAGVSVRRVLRTGRPKNEQLELVAYVFTNEAGEFLLPNLPEGEYRINFQYPGYPMNEDSYTTIFVGTALESQVIVEAKVQEGKIWVEKLNITGIYEDDDYNAEVFPNPTADLIHLKFSGVVEQRHITVSDLSGRTLYVLPAAAKEMAVSVQGWKAGVYLLYIVENGAVVKSLRVVVKN